MKKFHTFKEIYQRLIFLQSEITSFFDEKISFKRTLLSAVYIAAFLWIGKLLINGPEVYYKKGWSLPLKS